MSIREELEIIMKLNDKWFRVNKWLRDKLKALTTIISISIPTILLLIPHYSESTKILMTQMLLIISLVGMLASILPMIFHLDSRTVFNKRMSIKARRGLRDFRNNKISEDEMKLILEKLEDDDLEEVMNT